MEEKSENKILPYPVMDIDFLHIDNRFRSGSTYSSTIGTKIHFLVSYRCCFCGAENSDDDQCYRWETRTQASHPQTLTEKETQIVNNIKSRQGREVAAEKESDIEERRYEYLGLKCSCARCGKKQPWSDFWPVGGFFGALISLQKEGSGLAFWGVLSTILVLILLLFYPLALVGFIFLLFVPSIVALVHNKRMQLRSLRLEKPYRPEIRIAYKPDPSATDE